MCHYCLISKKSTVTAVHLFCPTGDDEFCMISEVSALTLLHVPRIRLENDGSRKKYTFKWIALKDCADWSTLPGLWHPMQLYRSDDRLTLQQKNIGFWVYDWKCWPWYKTKQCLSCKLKIHSSWWVPSWFFFYKKHSAKCFTLATTTIMISLFAYIHLL